MAEWQCSECGAEYETPRETCSECGGGEFDHATAIRLTGRERADSTVGASGWLRYALLFLLAAVGALLVVGFLL